MKRILLLTLAWLAYQSSYAQDKTTHFDLDSQPITKTGISLPQLVTIDLNRSNLQYKLNLSQGLNQPNLSVTYQKIIANSSKQFKLYGGTGINQSISLRGNDNMDFYTFQGLQANIGAEIKLFNEKEYFIEVGTHNSINKIGGISDFDFINTYNSATLGIGKGRINFSNDGSAAISITDKLANYGLLTRDLSEEEYLQLVELIRGLKNRRKFVNRSYPLTETEEIQELLISYGVLTEGINVIEIIHDAYRFEPLIDRTSGKQFRISATGLYASSNFIYDYHIFGLNANISYTIHTPLSAKWQYNRGINGYIYASEDKSFDPTFTEDILKRVGLSVSNDFHYMVDTRISYSMLSTVGYDFLNRRNEFFTFGDPFYNKKGMYLNTKAELKYQITRKMSTSFGVSLNITPDHNFTGLHLGLNF